MGKTEIDPMYSVSSAAAWLGVSQKAIWNWIYARRIPSARLGRSVRIKQSDLQKFIDAGTTSAVNQ